MKKIGNNRSMIDRIIGQMEVEVLAQAMNIPPVSYGAAARVDAATQNLWVAKTNNMAHFVTGRATNVALCGTEVGEDDYIFETGANALFVINHRCEECRKRLDHLLTKAEAIENGTYEP